MGQVRFWGKDRVKFFEAVSPADVQALRTNQARLSSFANENGNLGFLILDLYRSHETDQSREHEFS